LFSWFNLLLFRKIFILTLTDSGDRAQIVTPEWDDGNVPLFHALRVNVQLGSHPSGTVPPHCTHPLAQWRLRIDPRRVVVAFGSPIYEHLRALGFNDEVNFGLTHTSEPAKANMRAYVWDRMKDWLLTGAIE
jgi:hypothetical protein